MKSKNRLLIDLGFIDDNLFKDRLDSYLDYIFKLDLEIKAILLFGSVARGDAKNNDEYTSDIDLIIVCDDLPKDRWERRKYTFELTNTVSGGIQELCGRVMNLRAESKKNIILF